jgi:hypothetical protein
MTTSFFLFARPSFVEGMARTMDLGGTLDAYNERMHPMDSDRAAMHSDWEAVGADLLAAVEKEKERLGL